MMKLILKRISEKGKKKTSTKIAHSWRQDWVSFKLDSNASNNNAYTEELISPQYPCSSTGAIDHVGFANTEESR